MEEEERCMIPMDIVEEIMCYLPVKSLIRFRCVSKSWKSMISESGFIRKHLSRDTQKRLVVVCGGGGCGGDICGDGFLCSLSMSMSESKSESDEPLSVTNINYPRPPHWSPAASRVAFCDEMLLVSATRLSGERDYYLWNPSCRTCTQIPRDYIDLIWREDEDDRWPRYGLGYDSATDDYKVMVAPQQQPETWLYSLRSHAWTKIDKGFPPALMFSTYSWIPCPIGIYLNGALHWVAYPDFHSSGLDLVLVLVSFDLSTHNYRELPQPPYDSPISIADGENFVGIAALNGMLCVFLRYVTSPPQRLVLWIMNDYGVQESWTKLYEIHYHTFPGFRPRDNFPDDDDFMPSPLYLYNNGDLLIFSSDYRKIYIYKHHPTAPAIRTIVLPRATHFTEAFFYVESLASPIAY